ncbi:hypothetical protein BOS5A_200050 [Bosea sp. EC-HK365B]|nr:hypothetical protein BOSE21B_100050 [Bosea sp. 21B]CAD5286850.1 hypothetical protein BOSE7B_41478 [Bosea sp. 7B]VVT57355.1 hypothetical protein BOS5A_200050 [Bosea sp. EC-HK365B]VXC95109.1 hypothetical protein BOSE127_80264 [Bosea sp. 127]
MTISDSSLSAWSSLGAGWPRTAPEERGRREVWSPRHTVPDCLSILSRGLASSTGDPKDRMRCHMIYEGFAPSRDQSA